MRFFVAAVVLFQLAQVGYTQQSIKMPQNFKPITANDIVKSPPTNPNAPPSSPSFKMPNDFKPITANDIVKPPSTDPLAARAQAKAFHDEREKQVVTNNKGMLLGGVIGLVVAGGLLVWLNSSVKREEFGRREVLLCLVALGMLIILGIFKAIFTAAAIGAGSAMVVSFLIKQAIKAIASRLD